MAHTSTKDNGAGSRGPQLSMRQMARRRSRFILPTTFLGAAAVLLLASIFLPYWHLAVAGPGTDGSVAVAKYLNHVEGDVAELEALAPHIGMRPLEDLELIERSMSVAVVVVIALLLAAAVFVHNRWAVLISLPAMLFPAIFLADLASWLGARDGVTAEASGSIPLIGEGRLGEHATVAGLGGGMVLAMVASALIVAGLYFHRRAYRHWTAKGHSCDEGRFGAGRYDLRP